jgi:hypothetical protein
MSVRRIVYGPNFSPSDPQNRVLECGQLLMEQTTYRKFWLFTRSSQPKISKHKKSGCLVIRIQELVFTRQVAETDSPSQMLVAAASHWCRIQTSTLRIVARTSLSWSSVSPGECGKFPSRQDNFLPNHFQNIMHNFSIIRACLAYEAE